MNKIQQRINELERELIDVKTWGDNRCGEVHREIEIKAELKGIKFGQAEELNRISEVLDKIDFEKILLKAEQFPVHSDFPQYRKDAIRQELKSELGIK